LADLHKLIPPEFTVPSLPLQDVIVICVAFIVKNRLTETKYIEEQFIIEDMDKYKQPCNCGSLFAGDTVKGSWDIPPAYGIAIWCTLANPFSMAKV
jgi:hypothetical protein